MISSTIWQIEMLSNGYLSLIPHDLTYFNCHFIGVKLSSEWIPPPTKIAGKSLKVRDMVSWMSKAPVISERMKVLLQDLCGESVQFLKFHDLKSKPYYVMNVLAVVEDIIDVENSEPRYVRDTIPRKIYTFGRYVFNTNVANIKLPPIFKVSVDDVVRSNIFVTQPFVDLAIREKLTGFALMDPARDSMYSIIRGDNLNDVEGIVG